MRLRYILALLAVMVVMIGLTGCNASVEEKDHHHHDHVSIEDTDGGHDDSSTEEVLHDAMLFEQVEYAFDFKPTTPHLPTHLYKNIGNNEFVFLHFDKPVDQATKLLYTGQGIPGRFCKEDQDALPKVDGKLAYTHFHKKFVDSDNPQDGHGGVGGEEGWWFKHVAVAEFDMPWGHVTPGVDFNFMPTPPPVCGE